MPDSLANAVTPAGSDPVLLRARLAAVCALPVLALLGHPGLALLIGAAIVLIADRRVFPSAGTWSRYCLQSAIVLLGLRLDLAVLWELSATYSSVVAGYVIATFTVGLAAGRLLAVETASSKLIASGTAICGGTAIASLSGVVGAEPRQTAVALAIVFLLNVVALVTFPVLGRALDLTELQFGLWAALAIHDTSSVLATAALYGAEALDVATTIKLGRTLWLIPLVFGLGLYEHTRAVRLRSGNAEAGLPRLRVPGFILFFVAAVAVGSLVSPPAELLAGAGYTSSVLLVVALFLVGTELTRATVRQIRGRVLWFAAGLWLLVAPATLLLVLFVT